jgi:hypothetical protein
VELLSTITTSPVLEGMSYSFNVVPSIFSSSLAALLVLPRRLLLVSSFSFGGSGTFKFACPSSNFGYGVLFLMTQRF